MDPLRRKSEPFLVLAPLVFSTRGTWAERKTNYERLSLMTPHGRLARVQEGRGSPQPTSDDTGAERGKIVLPRSLGCVRELLV